MSTIEYVNNLTINMESVKPVDTGLPSIVVDEDIRAEARRRIEEAAAAEALVRAAIAEQEKKKAGDLEAAILEEKIRVRVEEEKIRRLAEQAVAEAEAKKKAAEREAAIAAEVERLKRRTKVEILEDMVAELRAEIAELKRGSVPQCRR